MATPPSSPSLFPELEPEVVKRKISDESVSPLEPPLKKRRMIEETTTETSLAILEEAKKLSETNRSLALSMCEKALSLAEPTTALHAEITREFIKIKWGNPNPLLAQLKPACKPSPTFLTSLEETKKEFQQKYGNPS